MARYKVWVDVERDDELAVGLPDVLYECDTYAQATAFIRDLPGWGALWDPERSDYREGAPENPPDDRPEEEPDAQNENQG